MSAAAPSIKGRFIEDVVEDVKRQQSKAIAERLGLLDQAVIRAPIDPNAWYDIRLYARLLAFLRDIEGDGTDDYLRDRGVRNAERMLGAGVYPQLDYLGRIQADRETEPSLRRAAFGRDLRFLSTMGAAVFNFTRWNPVDDPDHADRFRIEVSDAEAFPDFAGLTSEGFMNRGHRREEGEPDLWRYDRVRSDLAVFRMTRTPWASSSPAAEAPMSRSWPYRLPSRAASSASPSRT
jgi:hypothetical protein